MKCKFSGSESDFQEYGGWFSQNENCLVPQCSSTGLFLGGPIEQNKGLEMILLTRLVQVGQKERYACGVVQSLSATAIIGIFI